MDSVTHTPFRYSLVLLISVLFVSGCSGSSESNSGDSQVLPEAAVANDGGNASHEGTDGAANGVEDTSTGDSQTELNGGTDEPANGSGTDPEGVNTTRVVFDITVPVYSSDALQVRLIWGDIDTTAKWNVDQSWTASVGFPVSTTNQLVVTFNDDNGAITLGTYETSFTTGDSNSESLIINADEFDTERWDNDGDGISNLVELNTGTDPEGGEAPEPVQANLEVVQDKTFRITWQDSPTATYYRLLENPDGISGFNVVADSISTTIRTYDHRVALYKRTSARYILEACNNGGCTASDTMFVSGTLEQGVGYFKASNSNGGNLDFSHGSPVAFGADQFGSSVKLSADGNTLVIAAIREDSAATGINGMQDDDTAADSGAVYVFTRIEGEWQQQAYVKASNTKAGQYFGLQLGLSADGNTLAVGVSSESSAAQGINGDQDDDSANNSGAVYVFVRNNGAWQQESYLKASNAEAGDRFGYAIDLSGDGNTLVVGAAFEDGSGRSVNSVKDNEGNRNGAAYVFTRSSGTWSELAYLKSSNSDNNDIFGSAVSISVDGSTIAVYARSEDSISTGINGNQNDNSSDAAGAVYVFVGGGNSWQQEAYIKSSVYPDRLGEAQLSLNGDGNTLAIGVRENSRLTLDLDSAQANDELSWSGSVYLLTRRNSNWQHQAFIKASIPRSDGIFGSSLELSDDGNTLAVGSHGETNATTVGVNGDQNGNIQADHRFQPDVGAVYVFERKNEDWQQQAYVKASNAQTNDRYAWVPTGWSVGSSSGAISLSGDGHTLAVGATFESSDSTGINGDQNNNSAPASGAVYLY